MPRPGAALRTFLYVAHAREPKACVCSGGDRKWEVNEGRGHEWRGDEVTCGHMRGGECGLHLRVASTAVDSQRRLRVAEGKWRCAPFRSEMFLSWLFREGGSILFDLA